MWNPPTSGKNKFLYCVLIINKNSKEIKVRSRTMLKTIQKPSENNPDSVMP